MSTMSELVVLDPPAVAGTRIQLDLTDNLPPDGPDWGDAAVEQYLADYEVGSVPMDYRVPNRRVTLPLQLLDLSGGGGLTFEQVRTAVQGAAGLWQREGGWLARTITSSAGVTRTIYLDIVGATLKLGGGTLQALNGIDVDARLEIEALPDWYGDEQTDVSDDFSGAFPSTYWAYDQGSGTLSAAGGVLVPSSTSSKQVHRTDETYHDQQATVKYITPSIAGTWNAGVMLKRIDANNYIYAYLDNSANIVAVQVVGGVRTNVASAASGLAIGNSTAYWIRGRVEGIKVTAEVFTSAPAHFGSGPFASSSGNLTGAAVNALGLGQSGSPGIVLFAATVTTMSFDDFLAQPNVYVERSNGELITPQIRGISGNFPRGNRCRIRMAEAQGANQRGVAGAFRSRYYDSTGSAALAFEAEALTLLDTAASVVLTGASGGRAVNYTSIPTSWTPFLQLTLSGSNYLTHVGTYRMLARVWSTGGTRVHLRCAYDVGDLINPSTNDSWTFPGASAFYYADLGELRLERTPVGTHRWVGQIQAQADVDGLNVHVDRIVMVPLDEWEARGTAISGGSSGFSSVAGRDSFTQAIGALTGKTATVGGTWSGSGDADDFTVAGDSTVQRIAVSDASSVLGRYARLGAATTDVVVNLTAYVTNATTLTGTDKFGILTRYVDDSNWAACCWTATGVEMLKCVAGVITSLGNDTGSVGFYNYFQFSPGLSCSVDSDGNWSFNAVFAGSAVYVKKGRDADMASGGVLASGTNGIIDCHTSATAMTRRFDSIYIAANTSDAVLYANRLGEFRSDGLYRLDITGSAYGKVSNITGQLPRIPCEGAEGRGTELLCIASRGDFDQLPDPAIDDFAVQVLWKPCYWFTPDT